MKALWTFIVFWRAWRPTAQRRFVRLFLPFMALVLALALAIYGLRDSFLYFYTPAEYVALSRKPEGRFRLGGLVKSGSVQKNGDSLIFTVGDLSIHRITVHYKGFPPDLFREEQGVIADGKMVDNIFMADYLLAKHDEKYMPPQIESSLKSQGHIKK